MKEHNGTSSEECTSQFHALCKFERTLPVHQGRVLFVLQEPCRVGQDPNRPTQALNSHCQAIRKVSSQQHLVLPLLETFNFPFFHECFGVVQLFLGQHWSTSIKQCEVVGCQRLELFS